MLQRSSHREISVHQPFSFNVLQSFYCPFLKPEELFHELWYLKQLPTAGSDFTEMLSNLTLKRGKVVFRVRTDGAIDMLSNKINVRSDSGQLGSCNM